MPRTSGPLLPGENRPLPFSPAHIGVINVKSVHFHGRFTILTMVISSWITSYTNQPEAGSETSDGEGSTWQDSQDVRKRVTEQFMQKLIPDCSRQHAVAVTTTRLQLQTRQPERINVSSEDRDRTSLKSWTKALGSSHVNALRSGSGGTRTRICCYNITGSVKVSDGGPRG